MHEITEAVRSFYTRHPYPSYGEQVKRRGFEFYRPYLSKPGRYLEAGCGTGHVLVGIAMAFPDLEFHAIDISEGSLAVARKVAEANGVKVEFRNHNLMDALPFHFGFDYINCVGVIHHLERPEVGLRNLADHLSDDGVLFLHAYGEEFHRRRLRIKETLDIMQGDSGDYADRFELFRDYAGHHRKLTRGGIAKRLYRLSARDLILPLIKAWRRHSKSYQERSVHIWPDELENPVYSERWLDQFANPNERTYNLRDFCALLDAAGLEPIQMCSLGRYRAEHLPPGWKRRFDRLDNADQCRLMELLNPTPTSPFCVARRREGASGRRRRHR